MGTIIKKTGLHKLFTSTKTNKIGGVSNTPKDRPITSRLKGLFPSFKRPGDR